MIFTVVSSPLRSDTADNVWMMTTAVTSLQKCLNQTLYSLRPVQVFIYVL